MTLSGSSPRVRGRPQVREGIRERPGLIPAGAGQTFLRYSAVKASKAHPRGCGADALSKAVRDGIEGSSPRVRGRHLRVGGTEWEKGLIPAGAGQTTGSGSGDTGTGAHPRGCGADSSQPARLRRLKQLYGQLCGATVKVPRECGE